MADTYNFNFFQIPDVGVTNTYIGAGLQQHRDFGERISSFGALEYGIRDEDDYTKVSLGFKSKDELQNPTIPPFAMSGDYDNNPFVWGSTVKRIRNDELTIMLLGSKNSFSASLPAMDVSDTKNSKGPFEKPKNFPAEGWSSFGGRIGGPDGYVAPGTRVA